MYLGEEVTARNSNFFKTCRSEYGFHGNIKILDSDISNRANVELITLMLLQFLRPGKANVIRQFVKTRSVAHGLFGLYFIKSLFLKIKILNTNYSLTRQVAAFLNTLKYE